MAIALPPAKSQQQQRQRRRKPRTPYEILGVKPGCTDEELKRAYRLCVLAHHPDRGGDEKLFREATEAFEQIARERGGGELPAWAATLLSHVNAALEAFARGELSEGAAHLGAVVDEVTSHLHTGRALLGEQLGHAAAAREAAGRLDIGQAATHVAAFSTGVAANWPKGLAVVEGGKRLLSALTGGKKKRRRR